MLQRLLSHDMPRSRWLAGLLVLLVLALALTPFIFPGVKALNVAAKVLVFVVLVASFDLLLGYTGIVSFAHTMFFGIGAYGIAIATTRMGPTWEALAVGLGGSLMLSFVLALLVGLFSLRVRAIFFAMITLAVASAFLTLASQLHEITGGEDGISFKVPEILSPSYEFSEQPFLGVSLDGRLLCYYLLFVTRRGAVSGAAAHREFAVWPSVAGDTRKRVSRRSHWLPGGGVPHHIGHSVGAVCLSGRCHAGPLVALQRAGYVAVV
jgi:branched-chain amino acid transport system permease protein